jgi:carbonic anhydrase
VTDLQTLYERNAAFADDFGYGDLTIRPRFAMIILTCVDARLDPAYFAGLDLGDALVLRNAGARVTPAVRLEVSMLWTLMEMASGKEPGLHLAIVQHTACGMARFAEPEVEPQVIGRFGADAIATYAIEEPHLSVATDVERLRSDPGVPRDLVVSGHLYDVSTGRLATVVEPVRLAEGLGAEPVPGGPCPDLRSAPGPDARIR